MSYSIAGNDVQEEAVEEQTMLLQLGFFLLLFITLAFVGDATPAYATGCTGVANLTGPLLPVAV